MTDRIVIPFETMDALNKKVLEIESEVVKNEGTSSLVGIPLPKFTLDVLGFAYMMHFDFNLDTKILTCIVFDKDSGTYAKFHTKSQMDFEWGGMTVTSVKWSANSDETIRRDLSVPKSHAKMPYILKGKLFKYHVIISAFEIIQKSLLTLPSIWNKASLKHKVTVTPEEKLLRAITKKKPVTLQNVYTIISPYVVESAKPEFKYYSRYKCTCWGVRGHYRHLKNGKVIFVKAYRKGKLKDDPEALEGKDYKFKEE